MDGSTISNSLIAHSTSLAAAPGMASATNIASASGKSLTFELLFALDPTY